MRVITGDEATAPFVVGISKELPTRTNKTNSNSKAFPLSIKSKGRQVPHPLKTI